MSGDDLSNRSCLVADDGQFLELALRLSRDFGKVYYWNPTLVEGFPKVSKWAIGKGFDEIQWVEELWPIKDKVDLFVFPDILNGGLHKELESQGKRVIGSRTGDRLEVQRIAFKRVQKRLGLEVPKFIVCNGMTELRAHLETVDDRWIKISRFRGSFETEHHVNYELSQSWLNKLAVELGPLSDEMLFIVEEPVKHKIEFGYDGFCFDGELPPVTLFGPEVKSKCYIGSVTNLADLDERLLEITLAIAGELKKDGYRNFLSDEIIIAEDDENFPDGTAVCIEPTCRIPSPPFESELEEYTNLGPILWHGAMGEVITPALEKKFTVTVRLTYEGDPEGWRSLQIPDAVRQWFKLYDVCKLRDAYHISPKPPHAKRIGGVVGIGDTIEEAVEHCRANLDAVKEQPVNSEFEALTKALTEIQEAEKEGIEFTRQAVPGPEIVLNGA